jgi:hypothetical protein
MRHGHPVVLLVPLVLLPLLAGGCMSTRTRRVARYDTGPSIFAVERPAPRTGEYKVKYARAGHDLHAAGGTKRIVGAGDPLGFMTAEDGTVVAIAGDERIPLPHLPATARYCVWSFKERGPTQFTKEVGKATDAAATVTAFAGATALIAGLVAADVYLDSLDDKDDRECEEQDRRRPTPRGYRWVGPQQPPAIQPAAPRP